MKINSSVNFTDGFFHRLFFLQIICFCVYP